MAGGLNDQLNNCEEILDIYRRVPCLSIVPTPSPIPPGMCMPRDGESVTISATGDAYIINDEKDKGFNNQIIIVDAFPKTDGLIKWKLTTDANCECVTIKKVTLRLYLVGPTVGGGLVHIVNPTWDEDEATITWQNAPESSGPPLGRIGPGANKTWIELDVTG